ncbi:MAG: mechanosensitive ion channel family protein [Candidatus Woesearchaeota archaeon]
MLDTLITYIQKNPELVITLAIMAITTILMFTVHKIKESIKKHFKKKQSSIKKIIRLEQPVLIIISIVGIHAVISTYLKNYPEIHSNLNNLLVSLSIIIVTYMLAVTASVLLENWSRKLKKTRHSETHEGIVPLIKSVVYMILGILALIFILQTWRVSVGALLTSLGIAGVIIGFAFRDTLTNVFGGIALVLDDTFKKGDLIELPEGELGFVIETSLRSTKLKNFDNEEIYIPNSALANMKIINYAQPSKSIRIKIHMPVAIGENVQKIEKILLNMLDKREDVLKYPKPKVYFLKVQDYYLDLAIAFFIHDFHDLILKKSDITKEIYSTLQKHNIEIPIPARKIQINNK